MPFRRILWITVGVLAFLVVLSASALGGLVWLRFQQPPARLLVLDNAARLQLVAADGQRQTLATDVSRDVFRYPAVAPDGRQIAYIAGDEAGTALLRLDLRTGERQELYRSRENPPLYLTWSPDGQTISFLSNLSGGGLGAHVVPADGSRESELINSARGSTYFAWSSSSEMLLLHADGRLATYDRAANRLSETLGGTGLFQAPAWSVDGQTLFYVAQPATSGPLTPFVVESVLTRVDPGGAEPIVLVREPQAALFFSRAPASDRLAYTTIDLTQPGPLAPDSFGPLRLVGADSRGTTIVSRPAEHVVAFFWSPDGSRLAYLTATGAQMDPVSLRYTWHVVAVDDGEVLDLVSFTPSRDFLAMVNFFDAYAMSFSLWSPDGRQLTYSTDDGVYVVDATGGAARRVADGKLGLWAGPR